MVQKFLFRTFLVCFALFLFVVAAVVYSGWLIQQKPAFYSELRKQQFTESEKSAAEKHLEITVAAVEQWAASSVKKQLSLHQKRQQTGENADDQKRCYKPSKDQRICSITQDKLNAMFAGLKPSHDGPQNIRVQILENQIRLAGEIKIPDTASLVISADFNISHCVDNQLKLEIIGGQIGRLPVPLQWMLRNLPEEMFDDLEDCEVHFNTANPYLLFDIADSENQQPVLKSIETAAGEITMTFGAPIVVF